ncbi:TPA: cupin domain-containing protein, partial [Burkholderia vietnamiensis]|nr:cupin domain-containing protein [Burkholderia vietnamiensis]HDR9248297.1 cupin domain-containing protein [Burkholderia vietnamiensis]HDR9319912.1 cupin domain-containing protein [Burkholderia vietnamiensis]
MSQSSKHNNVPAERGQCQTIDLTGKIALIDGHWQPRVVAEMN